MYFALHGVQTVQLMEGRWEEAPAKRASCWHPILAKACLSWGRSLATGTVRMAPSAQRPGPSLKQSRKLDLHNLSGIKIIIIIRVSASHARVQVAIFPPFCATHTRSPVPSPPRPAPIPKTPGQKRSAALHDCSRYGDKPGTWSWGSRLSGARERHVSQ